LATAILLLINVVFFSYIIQRSNDAIPSFKSIRQFLPSVSGGIDGHDFRLAGAFFKQGIVKQLLTEGEKYMFTCFSLMTLAQQGK
jgi:hypothetical protein